MNIRYTCYAHNSTSMGVIANNVIRELSRLGINVEYKVLNTDQNPADYPIEVQKAIGWIPRLRLVLPEQTPMVVMLRPTQILGDLYAIIIVIIC
jgi:hypothetical protein